MPQTRPWRDALVRHARSRARFAFRLEPAPRCTARVSCRACGRAALCVGTTDECRALGHTPLCLHCPSIGLHHAARDQHGVSA